MISLAQVRKLAFALEEVVEQPHFEKISFRVKGKIFATVDTNANMIVLKLSEVDQSVFSDMNTLAIYPVSGRWGRQGWTMVDMRKVGKGSFSDALITAYCTVAPIKLSSRYRN